MSAFLSRLFLATALCALPAAAMADSHDDAEAGAATAEETTAETETADEADDEPAEAAAAEGEDGEQTDEWANKMRKRHHEGDVALGVCGARMSALMWFYQSSVADGRDDLQPAYEAIKESRTVLKQEAERRAVEDGVGTSVSVMNSHSEKLWQGLVEASDDAEEFQVVHDDLFTNVQECLSLFFNRGVAPDEPAAADESADDATDGAEDDAPDDSAD